MCDPDVLWLRDFQHSLEIIAYYALQNVTIPTWSHCLREDGKEFLKRNYTLIDAGDVNRILYFRESKVAYFRVLLLHQL